MKLKISILSIIILLGCGIVYFVFFGSRGTNTVEFEPDAWDQMVAEQLDKNLNSYFSSGRLPEGQEKVFLRWAFQSSPEAAETYVREFAHEVVNLPWFLSDSAWSLYQEKEFATAVKMLKLARELYPNNPDVLGITGIVAFLQGDQVAARRFLEEAESWRQNRPIVDYYLGSILLRSESAADRNRGKTILMGLVLGSDTELRELSGLTLLTNLAAPVIRQDLETIHSTLEANGTFQAGNPNLPAEALRIIIDRLARPFPNQAVQLADVLMEYPNANVEDAIGIIRLSQTLKLTEKARTHLDALMENPAFMAALEGDRRIERILAVQKFMEESYASGMEALATCVREEDADVKNLQSSFQAILQSNLPLSIESEVLELYLELPVHNPATSVQVLGRLVQIAPLGGERWVQYAIENLLESDPVRVGSWLAQIDAGDAVIAALGGDISSLSPDKAMVLINAYIKEEDSSAAEATLTATKGLLDPVLEAFFRAQVLTQQEKFDEAIEYWEEAYQGVAGSNRFPLLKNLGLLALQLDQQVNALQALFTAFSAGIPFSEAQAGELIRLTLEYGTLGQAIKVAEYLADAYPTSDVNKNNLSYFRFLADEKIEESVTAMRDLVEEYPDVPQFKLTLALGLVKAGRTNEANRMLKSTDINWQEMSTRGLLIYAVVLAASDQRSIAEGLLQNIDTEVLIPEEKALLQAL